MLINKAAEIIRNSNYMIALTGAGISTPSGIPDFRSPQSGLWEKFDPMEVATIWSFLKNPRKFYEFMFSGLKGFFEALPNPAHYSLAELEKKGILKVLITQNIDNLHQKAGSKNVIEVHGNSREFICISCKGIYPTEDVREKIERILTEKDYLPKCSCGGLLKPNVVLFGEQLPKDALFRSYSAIEKCDLMLIVGSSLVVQPVASFPYLAKKNGAKIIVVNLEETYIDRDAEVVIRDRVEVALPEILKNVLEKFS
jgi:NAD-dependent deacetylase